MNIRHDEVFSVNGRLKQVGVSFQVKTNKKRTRYAVFECECGSRFIGEYWSCSHVSKSCGCLHIEALKAGKHNENRIPKHGKCGTKVYHAWSNIIQRCTNHRNKHFKNYGGRGINVCDEWKDSFEQFMADVGDPPTDSHAIDRIDNNSGYRPGNVRWVIKKANQRNRRNTVFIQIEGVQVALSEVCENSGANTELVRSRLKRGWDLQTAIKTPANGMKK